MPPRRESGDIAARAHFNLHLSVVTYQFFARRGASVLRVRPHRHRFCSIHLNRYTPESGDRLTEFPACTLSAGILLTVSRPRRRTPVRRGRELRTSMSHVASLAGTDFRIAGRAEAESG